MLKKTPYPIFNLICSKKITIINNFLSFFLGFLFNFSFLDQGLGPQSKGWVPVSTDCRVVAALPSMTLQLVHKASTNNLGPELRIQEGNWMCIRIHSPAQFSLLFTLLSFLSPCPHLFRPYVPLLYLALPHFSPLSWNLFFIIITWILVNLAFL